MEAGSWERGPFSGLGVLSPFRDAHSSSKPTVAPEADAPRRGRAVGARLRPGELRRASEDRVGLCPSLSAGPGTTMGTYKRERVKATVREGAQPGDFFHLVKF